jgi:ankyrin repeat protein
MFATHVKHGCMAPVPEGSSWRRKCSFAHGITPLYVASQAGHTDTVMILLAAGADVDARNIFDGATALDAASRRGHASVVSALLDYGANAPFSVSLNKNLSCDS